MNPQRPPVLVRPLSALESFKPVHQKRGPRLMHTHAHPNVIPFLVEVLIALVDLNLVRCFLDDRIFNSLPKFIEGVL